MSSVVERRNWVKRRARTFLVVCERAESMLDRACDQFINFALDGWGFKAILVAAAGFLAIVGGRLLVQAVTGA